MKRFLVIPDMVIRERSHEVSVLINLDSIPIECWCLELCLLQNRLAEELIISTKAIGSKLRVSLAQKALVGRRAVVARETDETLIQVTNVELEYWLMWSLKYYRDGIADVDHIDVEIGANDGDKGFALTLTVGNAQPPVSAEEAKRRLGI